MQTFYKKHEDKIIFWIIMIFVIAGVGLLTYKVIVVI